MQDRARSGRSLYCTRGSQSLNLGCKDHFTLWRWQVSIKSTMNLPMFQGSANVGNGILTTPWVMTVLNIKTLPRLYLSRLSFKCMCCFNFGRTTKLLLKIAGGTLVRSKLGCGQNPVTYVTDWLHFQNRRREKKRNRARTDAVAIVAWIRKLQSEDSFLAHLFFFAALPPPTSHLANSEHVRDQVQVQGQLRLG